MDKVKTIIELTAVKFGIDESLLRQKSFTKGAKKREVANARMVAMVLLREHTLLSLKSIGNEFSGRDHTTVLNALSVVPDLVDTEKNFRNTFRELNDEIHMKFNPSEAIQRRHDEFEYAWI